MSLLDRVQSIATIAALEAAPDDYAAELAAGLLPATTLADLAARDAALAGALHQVDELAARVMRIRLDHAGVDLPAQTRRLFTTTVASYAGKLSLLGDRVRDAATRARSASPDALADAVVAAAEATLALREAVRAGVLALIARLAAAAVADADRRARDRDLDEPQRRHWSRARRDLETIAAEPAQILAAPMAARMAAWPDELDEPAPKPEPTLAELIELD